MAGDTNLTVGGNLVADPDPWVTPVDVSSMKVGTMDLGRLRVGSPDWAGPPDGWREVRTEFYMSPGIWRSESELRPDPTVDFFSEPLEELRAELRGGLDRFRAECAPRVGPEVTRRGLVVSGPVRVPVDPHAYLRHRFDLAAKACGCVFRAFGAALESLGRSFSNAFGGEQ